MPVASVDYTNAEALSVDARESGDTVEITVSDTGAGIADEVKERLFAPFVTSKPNGVGLGLGICRRIAEAHHGSLEGTNRAGGGAQFKLVLPIYRDHGSPKDGDC